MEKKILIAIAVLTASVGCSRFLDDAEYARITELAAAKQIYDIPAEETSI